MSPPAAAGGDAGGDPLLSVSGMSASVEGFPVTEDIDLTVGEGEAVGIVGRNGAGKTTTFRALLGLTTVLSGSVRFDGVELTELPAEDIPAHGLGYQPEDRKLFTGMSIDENLRMPIWTLGDERGVTDEDAAVSRIYDLFPDLANRRSQQVETLSGGQAKMVAIGRALAHQPDLVLLDEPLEGLAPVVVRNLKAHIREINDRGIAVLIAESNIMHVPEIVDRLYVLERGEIIASGDPEELTEREEILRLMQGSGQA